MGRSRTPRFMNLFSPERRSARTNRWRKRFPKFALSSWHSSRIVESVCHVFRAGAEASRMVQWATGSQVVSSLGSKSLRLEALEERRVLDGTAWSLAVSDFTQDWSNTALITADDDWSNVPSITGYRGDDMTAGTGEDPQLIVGPGSGTIDVQANETNPNAFNTGGVAEFQTNVLLSDDFDSYADQAAFTAAWPAIGSSATNPSTLLSTTEVSSAPNAVSVPGTGVNNEYRNRRSFSETPALGIGDQLVWSFDFYDSLGTGNPQRNYANLQDTAGSLGTNQLISMGTNNNQLGSASGGQHYMARILGFGASTTADPDGGPAEAVGGSGAYFKLNDFGGPHRSAGWHNLKVVISTDDGLSTDYEFYVDGQLAERVSNVGTAASIRQYDNIIVGSGLSNGNTAAGFDNMRLESIPASVAHVANNPVVALQGSGTADAPSLNIRVNATGRDNVTISYNLRDVDGSDDDSVQPVALQYRIGGTGDFVNVPTAFVADASTGPNLADLTTAVSATLPAWSNVSDLEFRIISADAVGSDEWIGVDDITITSTDVAPTVSVFGPTMVSEGHTQSYSFSVTDAGAANPHSIQYPSGGNFIVSNTSYDSNTQTGSFDVTFGDGDVGGTLVNLDVQASDGVLAGVGSLGVTIGVVGPSVEATGPASIEVGEVYSLALASVANPGADTVNDYLVDWGDGEQTQLTGAEAAALAANGGTLNHVYAANGSTTITVSLTDEDTSVATAAQLVIGVVDPPAGVVNVGGTDGDDTLVIDFAAGTYTLNAGSSQPLAGLTTINFGGGNGDDQLVFQGGAHTSVKYAYDNPSDGSVIFEDGAPGQFTVSYTGLEPIVNTGTAADVEFILTGGADSATLADLGGGMYRLSGASFEDTDFMLPTGSLTIRGGADADSLTVASAASVPAITLDFETVNLAADLAGTLAGGADTDVNVQSTAVELADAIALVAASGTIAVSAAGTYTGDLVINKALTLLSTVGTSAVIQGVGAGFGGAVRVTANDVTIGGPAQGFTINGAGESALYVVQGVDNVLVEDNTIVGAAGKLAVLTEGGVSDLTFEGNDFDAAGTASQLVYVNGQASVGIPSTNVSFTNNLFNGDAGGPLLGLESSGGQVTGNQLNGSSPYTQLELWGAGNNVAGNSFSGAGGGAYFLDPLTQYNSSTIVANNTFAAGTVTIERAGQFVEGAFSSIADAIAAADPGDTIHVSAGTFNEAVVLNKAGLTLVGAQAGVNPGLRTAGSAAESIVQAPSGQNGISIGASGVTLTGFDVVGGAGTVYGIAETTALSGTSISHNFVHDFGGVGVAVGAGSTGAAINQNEVYGNYAGVYLSVASSGAAVTANVIRDHVGGALDQGAGIVLEGNNTGVSVSNNVLANNAKGVYVWNFGDDFTGTSVSDNSITGGAQGVVNTGGGTINASGNWWGTDVEANIAALMSGNVDFTPFLDSSADDDLVAAGFQGDRSTLNVTTLGDQVGAASRIDEAVSLATAGGMVQILAGAYAGDVDATQGEAVTLSPVSGPGQVTISGNLTLDGDDALAMEIDGTTAGSLYDQLVVSGVAALGGSSLVLSGGYSPMVADSFTIIDASTLSGTFGNGPFSLNGVPLDIDYSGGDVVLSVSQPAGVWVDNDWVVLVDNGVVGTLDYGDIVESDADDNDNAVTGLVFGYNAFSSVGDAVDAVAIGGVINVLAGTFTEAVSIDKDLTILGQDAAESILSGGPIATPITVTSGAEVVIDGLTVAGGIFGIDLDASDATIRNSIVSGGSAVGILVDNGATLTVEDSALTGGGLGVGVSVVNGSADISGSVLSNRTDGVVVGAGGATTLFNNDLSAAFGNKAIQANPLAGVVDASGNWWGTTSEAGVQAKVLGTVDFTPYLNSGANSATGVGFDGDFSHLHVTSFGAQTGATGRIQEGVNLVDPNGVVQVHAGTYTELVTVNKTVSLRGEQYGVDARTRAAVAETIVNGPGGSFTLQADGIELDGFTVEGTTGLPLGTGIHSNSGFSGYQISNNIIQDNTIGLYLGSNGALQTVVEQNLIRDNDNPGAAGGTGIYSDQGLSNVLIQDNKFAGDNFTAGMNLIGFLSPVTGATISGNEFSDGNQLVLFNVDNSSVDANDFSGTALTGTAIFVGGGSDDLTVSNNTITNRGGSGIGFSDAGFGPNSDATITGNVISQDVSLLSAGSPTTRTMISVSQTSGSSSIDNNQITLTGAAFGPNVTAVRGIVVSGAATGAVDVAENTLSGGDVGTVGVLTLSSLGGVVTLEGNSISDFATGVQASGGTLDVESGNAISGGVTGMRFEGPSVGLAGLTFGDISIDASGDYITLANAAFDNLDLDATGATLGGVAVASMTAAQKFAATNKITDELDDNTLGLVLLATNTIFVTPAATPTATDNDYTRIKNAIEAAGDNWTIDLLGTFDWTESNAAASWALGNDGLPATDDDYSILVAGGLEGVTLTASTGLGSATIQGPGDIATANLEGFLYFPGGATGGDDNKNWTISNLEILDFDLGVGMFNSAAGVDAFDGTKILNNRILIATDLNATVAPADVNQNIGIHYSFGANQTIQGNFIDIPGIGVSDSANNLFASTVGMQSNTSGGAVYDGLLIDNNTITVTGAQSADPETILGIWENGHAHTSDVTVSNNDFINADPGNDPTSNLQRAFRVTSHSSGSTAVTYSGNTVSGANLGFQWLASSNFAGNQAVQLTGNVLTNVNTGMLIQSNGVANLNGNSLTNSGAMDGVGIGIDVAAGSIVSIDGSTNENVITGFATGIRSAGSVTVSDNDASIHGNAIGVDVVSGTAAITGNHIYDNGLGVRFTTGGGGSVDGNDFDGGAGDDNGTDLVVTASAGAISSLSGNAFAGDAFFIDNQSSQSFDLSANGTTFDEANNFRIEDKIHHRMDTDLPLSTGLVTWVAGNVFVTAPEVGSTDSSIQRGVDAVAAGGAVNVEAGTFAESVTIPKTVSVIGAVDGLGNAATTLTPAGPAASLIEIAGTVATDDVTIANFNFDGLAGTADYGVRVSSSVDLDTLSISNGSFTGLDFNAVAVTGDSVTGLSAQNVELTGLAFANNGLQGGGGTGDVQFFLYNGDATLTDLTLVGSATATTGARLGIQFRGTGDAAGVGAQAMGDVTLDGVDVSGDYRTQMIGIQRYSDVSSLALVDVALGGAGSEITGSFGASLRLDAVGFGSLGAPATIDLGNTLFRGLDAASAQRHEIEIAPDNSHTFLRADGTNTVWTIGGVDVAAASLTPAQAFAVEDRILHYVDKLNPTHGAYKGFVDIQAGQAFIGEDADAGVVGDGSIQRGVDIVAAGGTVNVEAGSFTENVTINKNVTLLSELGRASTTIEGISGAGSLGTIVVTGGTTDVNIGGVAGNGFTIVGIDNGMPGIENAAVYFQGGHSGADIRSNDVVANGDAGLSTEFGQTITNFVIDNNIFSGQTFVGATPADNGFANQFTTPNVPRQLVVMGGGAGSSQMTNLQFTNNQITGTAGGVNGGGEQGNTLVTVDGLNTTVSGNAFSGATTRFGASLRARGNNNTITDNVFNSAAMGASTVDVYVNRTGNVIQGNTFSSTAGAAIHVDNLGGATIGGAGVGEANSISDYSVGVLVTGVSASAVIDANTISSSGAGIGLNINAGAALIQGADLNGNAIGALIENGAIADLGQTGAGTNFTGLGVSSGGNDFSGYAAAATPTSGAIVNANVDAASGRQGAPPDVTALGNLWADPTPAGIETVVYHDSDVSTLGFVDFAAFGNLVVSLDAMSPLAHQDLNEGDSATVYGSFSNVPQPHTVTIDWGDGSAPTVINLAAGDFDFDAAHVYADDVDGPADNASDYDVTVTVQDASLATVADSTLDVQVSNTAPVVTLSGPTASGDGQTQSYTFTTSDLGDENQTPGELSLAGITATSQSGGATGLVSNIVFDPVTGEGSFDVTFAAPPGSGTVLVSVEVQDDDGASGVDSTLATVGNTLRVVAFQVNDSGFDVTFNRPLDLTELNLYDGVNPLVVGDMLRAADLAVHAVTANQDVDGSVVYDSATNTLSWIKTGGTLASDNYAVTLRSGGDAFQDLLGNPLDGNGDFTAGDDYQQAFNVTVVGGSPAVSLPDFARGPGQGVDLTANSTLDASLPVRATGTNVQGVNFELVYDASLLAINPLAVTALLPGWSVVASQTISSGIATLTVAAFTASPMNAFSGTASVVNIGAMVPGDAPYGASQALRLQNSEVNDDAALDDAALQKVMFPGDANGGGILPGSMPPSAYTGEDASLIARVVVGSDGTTGFDATPLVDPAIVGDASGNGGLNAFDASLVAQEAAAFNTPEVPDETAPGAGGFAAFDPELIIDDNQFGNVGHALQIPVKIAIEPTIVGVTSATYTVTFDPNVLDFLNAENGADFDAGWTVTANETPDGTINVSMFSVTPSGNNGGLPQELAKLNFTVLATALGLQSNLNIQPVDPNELGLIWTEDDGSVRGTYTADFDRDGDVDGDDLTLWENGFGTQPNATVTQGDEDADGDVDGSDFLAWQQQVGSTLPPAATASTVESFAASSASYLSALETDEAPAVAQSDLTSGGLAFQEASSWWLSAPKVENARREELARSRDLDGVFEDWSTPAIPAATISQGMAANADEMDDESLVTDDFDLYSGDEESLEGELDEAILAWLEG